MDYLHQHGQTLLTDFADLVMDTRVDRERS
jgi:hypothetical protein